MALIYVCAVVLGLWSAFFLVGYAFAHIECPFDRVAYYWTILASLVTSTALAYFLLGGAAFTSLATFALTISIVWFIMMDHTKMVHFNTLVE